MNPSAAVFPDHIFEELSKRELRDVLEISHYIARTRTVDDVTLVLHKIRTSFEFPQVIGGLAQVDAQGRFQQYTKILNISYPNDWLYVYAKNGYAEVDPIFVSLMRAPGAHVWAHTYEGAKAPKQLAFIEEAKGFGVDNGVSVSQHAADQGVISFFSFAGAEAGVPQRYVPLVHYLTDQLHEVLLHLAPSNPPNVTAPLTSRELTVLNWVKLGKTNAEIAVIMGKIGR